MIRVCLREVIEEIPSFISKYTFYLIGSTILSVLESGLHECAEDYKFNFLFITGYLLRTSTVSKPNLSYKRMAGLFGETLSEMAG